MRTGHYVPQLAQLILKSKANIKLKGIAVSIVLDPISITLLSFLFNLLYRVKIEASNLVKMERSNFTKSCKFKSSIFTTKSSTRVVSNLIYFLINLNGMEFEFEL